MTLAGAEVDLAGEFIAALSPEVVGRTLHDLASLWPTVTPWRLRRALLAVEIDITDDQVTDTWLVADEVMRDRAATEAASDIAFVPTALWAVNAAAEPPPPGLTLDPRLAERLPLLLLAGAVAEIQPGRSLSVRAVRPSSMAGADGAFTRSCLSGGLIVVADGLNDDRLAEVWAHELAHALDTDRGVSSVGAEALAEDLGPRLLAGRPDTLDEAEPHIAAALAVTASCRWRPPTTVEKLLALLAARCDPSNQYALVRRGS